MGARNCYRERHARAKNDRPKSRETSAALEGAPELMKCDEGCQYAYKDEYDLQSIGGQVAQHGR